MLDSPESFFDPLHLLNHRGEFESESCGETTASAPDSWEAASASIAAVQAAAVRPYPPEILAYRRVVHDSLHADIYYIVDVVA